MTFMRLSLEIDGKPDLAAMIGLTDRDSSDVCPAFHRICRESATTDQGLLPPMSFPEECRAMQACAGVFSFFSRVVSYESARAVLHGPGSPVVFTGSAQCVAAFSLLCCLVHSGCGYMGEYAFLLRNLCALQGHGELAQALEPDGALLDRVETAGMEGGVSRQVYGRFIDQLCRRTGAILENLDREGGNDTLRNACQILYSVGSLALTGDWRQDWACGGQAI